MRCAAITKAGERCRLDATSGSYCWAHAPENAEARRAKARRGGKARGAGEMGQIKREIRSVLGGTLSGRIDRGVAAVCFQGFNTLLKAIDTERKIRELDELEERIERLEEQQRQKGGRRWG